MNMPDIVKRIGCADEKSRVYIEDYAYSYLNGLREKTDIFPLRAALFGRVIKKENLCYYLIYGASSVMEELEYGRDEQQVQKEFFEDYELIGYVNITKRKQAVPEEEKGYFIFYESNEAMQNYLSFCYARGKRERKRRSCSTDMIRQIFTLLCIFVLAMAVCTVNDYNRMYGFLEMTGKAVNMMEREG